MKREHLQHYKHDGVFVCTIVGANIPYFRAVKSGTVFLVHTTKDKKPMVQQKKWKGQLKFHIVGTFVDTELKCTRWIAEQFLDNFETTNVTKEEALKLQSNKEMFNQWRESGIPAKEFLHKHRGKISSKDVFNF